MNAEKYLNPKVIQSIARLDLHHRFIVEGFLSGLHASPFQGFSVEFSEHRRYAPGDDVNHLDWNVYAKTERYYVKKFQAETNVTGYLAMDLSESMNYAYRKGAMTKFDYSICLAAALGYLMVHQQDPVGLVTFDTAIRASLPPRSKRTQLGTMLSLLANAKPTGPTDVAASLHQLASMVRGKSLVMVFSDLLAEPEPIIKAVHHLRHRGHEVILFHVLDEAEVGFPFRGATEFEDVEGPEKMVVDADGIRDEYLDELRRFRERYAEECNKCEADFVPIDTGVNFDKALLEYLLQRQRRF